MPSHQGEIAFPGGKLEPGVDARPRDAALREAHEEIGLDAASSSRSSPSSTASARSSARFVLTPFVGLLDGPSRRSPPTRARSMRVFDVALSELLDDARLPRGALGHPGELGDGRRTRPSIHFYELAGETVWGATARILTGFLAHLDCGCRSTLDGDVG